MTLFLSIFVSFHDILPNNLYLLVMYNPHVITCTGAFVTRRVVDLFESRRAIIIYQIFPWALFMETRFLTVLKTKIYSS
jgi:hypothetical protein